MAASLRPVPAEEFRKCLNMNDWRGAQEILKKNPAFLNAPDDDGLTPLQAAISEGNTDMIAALLKREDLNIGDALLHAVEKGDRTMVDLVMVAMKRRKLLTDTAFEHSTHFKFYVTPLMLACMKEDYNLVSLFLRNGHLLRLPHGGECGCDTCVRRFPNGEKLEHKMHRIDCYAAASSLVFVLHQEDPFGYAMKFSRYLETCKEYDPSYTLKYEDMISKLNNVTVSLIADCDKQVHIEALLNRGNKGAAKSECVFGFPRVHEALLCHHKQFLAQASCQSVMYDAYCGTWNDFFRVGRCRRLARWALHTVLYPFTALIYALSCGYWPKSYCNPTARFISSFCSFVVFLAMLIFYTQHKEDRTRLGMPSRLEKNITLGYLYFYLAGMWAVFLTDVCRLGIQRLFDVWWRQFDFVFLAVWTCTLFSYADAIRNAECHGFWDLHRSHWRPAEPQLIYEIFFTWAAIMSSVRLFYYGQVLSHFGVVTVCLLRWSTHRAVISICRCVPTILKYVVVLFVVLASFAIGLNHLYEHYKDNVVVRSGREFMQPFQLTSIFTTARYLYWAFYGYLPPENWQVVVGNVGHGDKIEEKHHHLISNTGELMSGVYHVIELIILLNLMVSIMTAAAVSVVDKELVEWKFVCAEIWMEYFQDSRVLPPPFNLIQLIINGCIFVVRKISGSKGPLSVWDCNHKSPVDDPRKEQKYKEMISSLKSRLRMTLDNTSGKSKPSKGDDVAALNTKIASSRGPEAAASSYISKRGGGEATARRAKAPSSTEVAKAGEVAQQA